MARRSTSPCVGRGENDALFGGYQVLELLDEGGNGAMEAKRGPGVDCDFAEGVVFVEHVDGAELIEVEAGVRFEQALQNFRAKIDVFWPDERADAAALVALLDLVPPAIDLVAHHGRFFDKEHAAWATG